MEAKTLKQLLLNKSPKLYNAIYRMRYPTMGVPFPTFFLNLLVQRILRVNGNAPWMVHYTSSVTFPSRIKLGKRVWLSFAQSGNCYIQALNGIVIGDNTIFAPGVKIVSANHSLENHDQHEIMGPIIIGKNCWIGANAVILPGVSLGDGCVVGAGAVVTKSFEDHSLILGIPAKMSRKLK